jgi:hypothetical protein
MYVFGFNTGTKETDKVGFRSLTACFTAFKKDIEWANINY